MLSVPVAALCCTGSRAFTIMIVPVYSVTAAVRSIGYPVKHGDVADRQQLPLFVAIDGATPAPCATRLLHGHNIAGRPRHGTAQGGRLLNLISGSAVRGSQNLALCRVEHLPIRPAPRSHRRAADSRARGIEPP